MIFTLQQGLSGVEIAHPVHAVVTTNSAAQSIPRSASYRIHSDTNPNGDDCDMFRPEDTVANSSNSIVYVKSDGVYICTSSHRLTSYSGTTDYRSIFITAPVTGGRVESIEQKYNGSANNGLNVASTHPLLEGMTIAHGIWQSGATTVSLVDARLGVIKVTCDPLISCGANGVNNQSFTTATETAHRMQNTPIWDYYPTTSMYNSAANTRLTVPPDGDGWYVMSAYSSWTSALGGYRTTTIRKNGSGILGKLSVINLGGTTTPHASALAYLVAGDYIENVVYQNSGSTRSTVHINSYCATLRATRVRKNNSGVMLTRSTVQSVNANSVLVRASFDTVENDMGGYSDIANNATRLTVPEGGSGWYFVQGYASFAAVTGGDRKIHLVANVSSSNINLAYQTVDSSATINAPSLSAGSIVYMRTGDFVEMHLLNSHTAAVNASAGMRFGMVRVDRGNL